MRFSDPAFNVRQFNVRYGSRIGDFGCGSGYYTHALAERVGPEGRVYAIDAHGDLLFKVKNDGLHRGFSNIHIIRGDIGERGGTMLADGHLDGAILANVLFFIENKEAPLLEVWRTLKPGGKLLLIDWKDSYGGLGPVPEHIVREDAARQLLQESGFRIHEDIQAGAHHYGMIATKYDTV